MSKDTIYRQDAIDEIRKCRFVVDAIEKIRGLPSAESERQRGRWIEYIPEHGKCPFCGNQIDLLNGRANNFCSECGADLRGEAE